MKCCRVAVLMLIVCLLPGQSEAGWFGLGQSDEDKSWAEWFEDFHDEWTEKVSQTAMELDTYFGDPGVAYDFNSTRIEVAPRLELKQGEGASLSVGFGVNLQIPALERRFNLIVSSWEDRMDDAFSGPSTLPGDRDSNNSDTVVGLMFRTQEDRHAKWRTTAGLKSVYYPYLKSSLLYDWEHNAWAARPYLTGYYYSNDGLEGRTGLDLSYRMGPQSMFRSSSQLGWEEKEADRGVVAGQSLSWYGLQSIGLSEAGVAVTIGANFYNHPYPRMNDAWLELRSRHLFKWSWMFFELAPRVSFPELEGYHPVFEFEVLVDIIFQQVN